MNLKIFFGICLLKSFAVAQDDGNAQILQYDFENRGDGPYRFSFQTSNGISRNETGEEIPSIHDETKNAALVKGSFRYTGADGVVYSVNYVADEAGFHPEGDHIQVPPFTPWVPGQPIDDGQYKGDISGQYKPDNSGQYQPEITSGERILSPVLEPKQIQNNYISGERILNAYQTTQEPPTTVTQKYLPFIEPQIPQNPTYTSGERILDAFQTAKPPSLVPVTQKYLPTFPSSNNIPSYTSGENILNAYQQSTKVTPQYIPSYPTPRSNVNNFYTTSYPKERFTTENPLQNEFIKKAFFNKPTPHPEILLHSTPNDRQGKFEFPKPFGAASQHSPTIVKPSEPKNEVKISDGVKQFEYGNINPELRKLIDLI